MKSLIKLSLIALLSATSAGTAFILPALAGSEGVTPPDSSGVNLDGMFSPSTDNNDENSDSGAAAAAINDALAAILSSIESSQTATSPSGETLSLTPAQAGTIVAALTATGADVQPAIAALEQQIAAELNGLDIDISVVGSTPSNLTAAITAANVLINSLSSEQLAAALESPTLAALRQILSSGKRAGRRGRRDTGSGLATNLPIMNVR